MRVASSPKANSVETPAAPFDGRAAGRTRSKDGQRSAPGAIEQAGEGRALSGFRTKPTFDT